MSYTEVAHDYLWGKDVGMGFTFDARGDMLAAISIHVREEGDSNTQGDMVADSSLGGLCGLHQITPSPARGGGFCLLSLLSPKVGGDFATHDKNRQANSLLGGLVSNIQNR